MWLVLARYNTLATFIKGDAALPTYAPKESIQPGLLLAEQVDPELIWAYNHIFPEAELAHEDASAMLEQEICQPTADAQLAIRGITAAFQECQDEGGLHGLRAGLVLASMPYFTQRILRAPITAEHVSTVYAQVGQLLAGPLSYKDGGKRGYYYEVLAAAISARRLDPHYAIQPSMVREESLSSRVDNVNHDGYTIDAKGKVPLQIRGARGNSSVRFGRAVHKLYIRDIICSNAYNNRRVFPTIDFRTIDHAQRPPLDIIDDILGTTSLLLHAESQGHDLRGFERSYLQQLSRRVMDGVRIMAKSSHRRLVAEP
jgi:hypothetical protein